MSKEPVIDSNININPAPNVLHKRLLDISRVLNSGQGGPEVLVNGSDIPDQTFVDLEQGANIAIVVQPNKSIKISATGVGPGTVTEVDFTSLVTWLVAAITNPTTTPALTIDSADGLAGNEVLSTPNGSAGKLGVRPLVHNDVPFTVPDTRAINTTSPLTGGGDLSADRTLDIDVATSSSVGVVKPDNSTITVAVDGTISATATPPPPFNPFTTAQLYEEFIGAPPFTYGWSQSGAGAVADFGFVDKFGVVSLSVTSTGATLWLGEPTGGAGDLFPADFLFEVNYHMKLSAVSANLTIECGPNAGGAFSSRITIEYDPINFSDTHWMYVCWTAGVGLTRTSSGVVPDTSWHDFRIRSTTLGEILFSIDGGTETMVNTNVPGGVTGLNPAWFSIAENAGVATKMSFDWFTMQMTRV